MIKPNIVPVIACEVVDTRDVHIRAFDRKGRVPAPKSKRGHDPPIRVSVLPH